MKLTLLHTALLASALSLCPPTSAQGVGTKMPPVELDDFALTPAKSFDDFLGRAVLIEFFAYW